MRLLVAFDGSSEAKAALEVVGRLIPDLRGDAVVVHLLNRLTAATGITAPTAAEALPQAQNEAWHALALAIAGAGIEGATPLVKVLDRGEDVAMRLQRMASDQCGHRGRRKSSRGAVRCRNRRQRR